MAPHTNEMRRSQAAAEFQDLLREGQEIHDEFQAYKDVITALEPRPDLRPTLLEMKQEIKTILTRMDGLQREYSAAGAVDDLRRQDASVNLTMAITSVKKQIAYYTGKVPLPTAPTFKPIKALQPEVLSIEADTDTKDKWLRQYETYYYQSKINETDKAMQLALVTACLDAKLTEACVGAGQVPTITKQGTGNTHFKVIKAQFNSRHPLYMRRYELVMARQKGEPNKDWALKVQNLIRNAEIAGLNTEDFLLSWARASTTDERFHANLCREGDLTWEKFMDIAISSDLEKMRMEPSAAATATHQEQRTAAIYGNHGATFNSGNSRYPNINGGGSNGRGQRGRGGRNGRSNNSNQEECALCGGRGHNLHRCKEMTCDHCNKKGHSKKFCRSAAAAVEVATSSHGGTSNATDL